MQLKGTSAKKATRDPKIAEVKPYNLTSRPVSRRFEQKHYSPLSVGGQVLFLVFDTSLAGWGEPVRAMMWDQRWDRIGEPSRSQFRVK